MAHNHDLTIKAFHSGHVQHGITEGEEEEDGKVYHEEDILAQVMIEEDLFPESDAHDVVVVSKSAFSPLTTTSSIQKPLPTPPPHRRAPALRTLLLLRSPAARHQGPSACEEAEAQEAPKQDACPHHYHHYHHHDDQLLPADDSSSSSSSSALVVVAAAVAARPVVPPLCLSRQLTTESAQLHHADADADAKGHDNYHDDDDDDGDHDDDNDGGDHERQKGPLLLPSVPPPPPPLATAAAAAAAAPLGDSVATTGGGGATMTTTTTMGAGGAEEERGRKLRSPRGDLVEEVLPVPPNEQRRHQKQDQQQQQEQQEQQQEGAARRRLPPGAVGWGKIVPPNFALRKSPSSRPIAASSSSSSSPSRPSRPSPMATPSDGAGLPSHEAAGGGRAPHAQLLLLASRSAATSPRFPAADMDHTDGAAGLVPQQKGRRRAQTVAAPPSSSSSSSSHEPFEWRRGPGLGSSASCSSAPMSRAEQERRVRKESMEYLLECPLPPLPEAEWWDPATDGAVYDDIDISGDGDEPATPQPGEYGEGRHAKKASILRTAGLGSSSSSRSAVGSVDEPRHKRCLLQ